MTCITNGVVDPGNITQYGYNFYGQAASTQGTVMYITTSMMINGGNNQSSGLNYNAYEAFNPGRQVLPVAWYSAGQSVSQGPIAGGINMWGDVSNSTNDLSHNLWYDNSPPPYLVQDPIFNNQPSLKFIAANSSFMFSGLGSSSPAAWKNSLNAPLTIICIGYSDYTTTAAFFYDDWTTLEYCSSIAENNSGTLNFVSLLTHLIEFQLTTPVTNALKSVPSVIINTIAVNEPLQGSLIPPPNGSMTYINGAITFQATYIVNGPMNPLTGLTIGSLAYSAGSGDYLNGKIAEFVVIKGILTQLQAKQISSYYGAKFGIIQPVIY